MKKWLIMGSVLLAGLLIGNSLVYAANTAVTTTKSKSASTLLRPAIQLDSIVPVKGTETAKNEIYVSVSEFNSNNKNRYYTIPQSPVYWPKKSMDQISNFQLWQGKLPTAGAAEVVISLIERDTPPWKLDDLISVIKVKMINNGGQLYYEWYQDGKLIDKQKDKIMIDLNGSSATYKASFSLLLRSGTKAQRSPDAVMDKK